MQESLNLRTQACRNSRQSLLPKNDFVEQEER